MSDFSSYSERRSPARREPTKVADYTMLVRVPGKPWEIRTFTDAQAEEAAEYAAEHGTEIEPLP